MCGLFTGAKMLVFSLIMFHFALFRSCTCIWAWILCDGGCRSRSITIMIYCHCQHQSSYCQCCSLVNSWNLIFSIWHIWISISMGNHCFALWQISRGIRCRSGKIIDIRHLLCFFFVLYCSFTVLHQWK